MIIEKRAAVHKNVEVAPATAGVRNPAYTEPPNSPVDVNGGREWACNATCPTCHELGRVVRPLFTETAEWLKPPTLARYEERKVDYVTVCVETRSVSSRTTVEVLVEKAVRARMQVVGEAGADHSELRRAYRTAYTAAYTEALRQIRRGCDAEVRESMR